MKLPTTYRPVLTWLLTAMLVMTVMSCTDSSEEKTSTKEVQQETQDLVQALEDYSVEQREEAFERTNTALDKLDKRINALETRIDNNWDQMNEAAREEARADLKALRKQRAEVTEWNERLKNSSADAWEHTKKGFSDAYKDLSDAWQKAENEFDGSK